MARKRKSRTPGIQLVTELPTRSRGTKFQPFIDAAHKNPTRYVRVPARIGDRTLKANGCKLFVRKGEFFIQAA